MRTQLNLPGIATLWRRGSGFNPAAVGLRMHPLAAVLQTFAYAPRSGWDPGGTMTAEFRRCMNQQSDGVPDMMIIPTWGWAVEVKAWDPPLMFVKLSWALRF